MEVPRLNRMALESLGRPDRVLPQERRPVSGVCLQLHFPLLLLFLGLRGVPNPAVKERRGEAGNALCACHAEVLWLTRGAHNNRSSCVV